MYNFKDFLKLKKKKIEICTERTRCVSEGIDIE